MAQVASAPPKPASPLTLFGREPQDMDYISFEGGAAFGMAYPSAMHCLERAYALNGDKQAAIDEGPGFKWPVKGVSGTSIGAIFAYLFALGYSAQELSELGIRDRLFAKVFDEKIEYGRILAAAFDPKSGTTRMGWFGDGRHHKKDDWKLNDLLKASTRIKDQDIDTRIVVRRILEAEIPHLISDKRFVRLLSMALDPALSAIGLPKTGDSLKKEMTKLSFEVLVQALLEIAGNPVEEFGENFNADRFASEINQAINEKMAERFELLEEVLGDNPLVRVRGWFPMIFIGLVLLQVERWWGAFNGTGRKSGRKNDFFSTDKLDEMQELQIAQWLERKPGAGPNRNHKIGGQQFLTILLIVGANILTDKNLGKQLTSLAARFGRFLSEVVRGGADFNEFFGRWWAEVLRFLAAVLISNPLKLLLKSLADEAGILRGQMVRDILVYATFNKCSVQVDPDRPFTWRLVRRPESLVDTLGRLTKTVPEPERMQFSAKYAQTLKKAVPVAPGGPLREPKRFKNIDDDLFKALTVIERHIAQEGITNRKEILKKWELKTIDLGSLASSAALSLEEQPQRFGYYPVSEQFRIIEEELTFEKFHEMLGVDLVCTSANYSTSSACYWRRSLTPDFPVIEAARTAGAFPVLFKPTAIAYRPASGDKGFGGRADQSEQDVVPGHSDPVSADTMSPYNQSLPDAYTVRDWFYDTHYRGFFGDAGIFNNLPIHAFNGLGWQGENLPEGVIDPNEFHQPHEALQKPLNPRVLGFELTNEDLTYHITRDRMLRPPPSPFAHDYTYRSGMRNVLNNDDRSLMGLINNIFGALYAMSGKFRRLDLKVNRAIVPVIHGNVAMFDMRPNDKAIRDCFEINIRRISEAFALPQLEETVTEQANKLVGHPDKKKEWKARRNRRLKLSGLDTVLPGNFGRQAGDLRRQVADFVDDIF